MGSCCWCWAAKRLTYAVQRASRLSLPKASPSAGVPRCLPRRARRFGPASTNCMELALKLPSLNFSLEPPSRAHLQLHGFVNGRRRQETCRERRGARAVSARKKTASGAARRRRPCVAFWCATGRDRARTPPPCRRSTHALRSKPQAPPFLSSAKRVQVRLCHNAGGRAEEVLSRGTARPRARAAYPSPGAPVATPSHTPPQCVRDSWSDGLLTLTLTLTSSSSSRARLRRDRIPMLVTMP